MRHLETISKSLHLTRHQIALGIVSLVLQADGVAKTRLNPGQSVSRRKRGGHEHNRAFLAATANTGPEAVANWREPR